MNRKALRLSSFLITFLLALQIITVGAVTNTFQPSSEDAQILSDYPDTNYETETWLAVCNTPERRSLVQFDLSTIPAGSRITSAMLRLHYGFWATNNPAGRTYWAYRVTQSWTEAGVTWNKYDGVNNWLTSGGDYSVVGGDSQTVPSDSGTWMSWDVTGIVTAWMEEGQPNYGFIIKDEDETGATMYFAYFDSKEHANPGWHPQLIVTYTPNEPVGGLLIPVEKITLSSWAVSAFVSILAIIVYTKQPTRKL